VTLDQVVKVRVLAPQPSRARSRSGLSHHGGLRKKERGLKAKPSSPLIAAPSRSSRLAAPCFKTRPVLGRGRTSRAPFSTRTSNIPRDLRRHGRQRLMRRPRARGAYGLRRDSHYSIDWGVVVEYDSSLGRTQGFTVGGFFLRPFGRFRPRASPDLLEQIDAAGGAVTPPTAYQGVSERPHEPGSNDSSRSRIAAVRIPISAALRRACCQICQHDLNTSESPGTR
jgi:hypothetical protein